MSELTTFQDVNKLLAGHVPSLNAFVGGAYKLDRMERLMATLGNPQDSYKTIHVAGTSGKTSTSYYIAAILKAVGQKAGLTVSPHIDAVNERVQINLQPLAEEKFCHQFNIFMELVERIDIKPTYFELLVGFAFWQFAEDKVDYAVIEVGRGGLLDATNVINSSDKVCVITDIGLDHTVVLGRTLGAIAAQKAGIIQKGNQVIMYRQSPEVMDVIQKTVYQRGGKLTSLEPMAPGETNLLPIYQQHNYQLAYAASQYVRARDDLPRLSPPAIETTMLTYIPARMEIVERGGKSIIMDGAHNAQKMQALASSIKAKYDGQKIATLLALMKSEDFAARTDLAPITALSNHLILTSFSGEQDLPKVSVDPKKVAAHCRQMGFNDIAVIKDPEAAYEALLKRPEPILLITGSFYLMNHIRPLIGNVP